MIGHKSLLRFYLYFLNSAILLFLLLIALTYTSGGISFSFLSFNIKSYSLIKPAAILIALFLLKVITDSKWREFSRYIFSIKGLGFCLLVSMAGLASGLFYYSYDIENPGIIIGYLFEGSIPSTDFKALSRYLSFHLILFNTIWILYSRIVSKSRSLSFSPILNKDGLIMGIGLLYLLFLRGYVYVELLMATVPALMVALKALMLKPLPGQVQEVDDVRIERLHYFKATIIVSVAYFILTILYTLYPKI